MPKCSIQNRVLLAILAPTSRRATHVVLSARGHDAGPSSAPDRSIELTRTEVLPPEAGRSLRATTD